MSYKLIKTQFQKYKIGWKNSFLENFAQDSNHQPLPWMTYPFIEFISQKLQKNHEIFEFGCGSSTLFFAKRVKKIITLESDKKWLEIMRIKALELALDNIEFVLIEDAQENESYQNYVKNCCRQKFDFIIVDSLKRFECSKNSFNCLKENGALILDDSERLNYQKIFEFMQQNGFKRQDFTGIAPGQFRLKNTSFFTK